MFIILLWCGHTYTIIGVSNIFWRLILFTWITHQWIITLFHIGIWVRVRAGISFTIFFLFGYWLDWSNVCVVVLHVHAIDVMMEWWLSIASSCSTRIKISILMSWFSTISLYFEFSWSRSCEILQEWEIFQAQWKW